ncbi:RNA polymerase factor sigma-54 [Panacagrimonas sp.]|uniref:RNA polymerase factor sigma-54 n=1 Tax=Panacagrimonas sp. TaxID=2480088 RepID=UPI003B51A416
MKQSLALRQGLGLTMTPALQQAIRLLQLSSLDLQMEIQQALESNLMLEQDQDPLEPSTETMEAPEAPAAADSGLLEEVRVDETIPEDMPVDADWGDVFDDLPSSTSSSSSDDDSLHDFLQANLHTAASLYDHLMSQARVATFSEVEALVAAFLIDAINSDGYLEDWEGICERLAQDPGVARAQVEAVLSRVQEFDPPGVAARDLAECLTLQVRQMPRSRCGRWAALEIVECGLIHVARQDEAAIMRITGLTPEDIRQGLDLIRTLQPHPGRPFQAHESDYLMPDVIVTKKNGRWKVALNPEHAPKLRINGRYQGFIKRADQSKDQLQLKQHLQEARYFINSLESRNETILRVSQCIVEEQRAFLEYGEEAMRPLVLRDVAQTLGIHESTVSRATANKYMLTPRGLYELKYFFSSHVATTQGGVASATAIQAMIKRMIGAEDPARPLSDSTLAELLLKEGIQVARRTVAKYREALHIPPSHERKAVA